MTQAETVATGTLRVLILVHGDMRAPYARFLAWDGMPVTASVGEDDVGSELENSSIDFGDEAVAPPPSMPAEPGMWLLRWDWRMVPCEEQWDEGEVEMTARYASECRWTRPSTNDLSEMGMLG